MTNQLDQCLLSFLSSCGLCCMSGAPGGEGPPGALEPSHAAVKSWMCRDVIFCYSQVSFPRPLYPLVSSDVLVESFEKGRHISYYIAAAEGSHPYRQRLAELGSGTMLQVGNPGRYMIYIASRACFLALSSSSSSSSSCRQ